MDPRRLVGASMSARKRAIRARLRAAGPHPAADLGHDWDRAALRREYRIGQRLRPCCGCIACHPAPETCKAWLTADGIGADCYPFALCDGSGVFPARRATRGDSDA